MTFGVGLMGTPLLEVDVWGDVRHVCYITFVLVLYPTSQFFQGDMPCRIVSSCYRFALFE